MIRLLLTCTIFISSLSAIGQSSDTLGNQKAYYECQNPTTIDSANINLKSGQVYFDFYTNKTPKRPKRKEFYWLKDYPKTYFVSFLINTTDSVFRATRQDGSLIMIQEALDENGNWSPIEYWVYSGCGNSYFDPLVLNPGESIFVPIKKYTGDFKTKIRLRFKHGDKVIYSDSFDASIDKTQFNKETNSVHGILYNGPANYLIDQ